MCITDQNRGLQGFVVRNTDLFFSKIKSVFRERRPVLSFMFQDTDNHPWKSF